MVVSYDIVRIRVT